MASQDRPRTRRSLAHVPSQDEEAPLLDQENLTTDIASASLSRSAAIATARKQRSKSLGPGGVATLKEDAGNKRKVPAPYPKSILKPSIPLSPLREIPLRKTPARESASPSRVNSSTRGTPSPQNSKGADTNSESEETVSGSAGPKTTVREPVSANNDIEKDELAASVQESEREQRRKQREDIQKQRDARRKSMANRRVSFAPEATLHTWDLIDDMQDSTTSSASTNSTRRASAASAASGATSPTSRFRPSMASVSEAEIPSTPTKPSEEDAVAVSPAHQRDLHQKKYRRRSSAIPPTNLNDPNGVLSSSPHGGSLTAGDDEGEVNSKEVHDDSSGSGTEEDEPEEVAVHETPERVQPAGNAVAVAEDDEDEDVSMDLAADDVTAAFQPFAKSTKLRRTPPANLPNKENVDPFSLAFEKAQNGQLATSSPARSEADDGDVSMDVTRDQGMIFQPQQDSEPGRSEKAASRRKSTAVRRRSSGGDSIGDGTMEFTAPVGSIRPESSAELDESQLDQNEDLSMEFTGVIGGIERRSGEPFGQTADDDDPASQQLLFEHRRASAEFTANDGMDMTTAVGKIQSQAADVASSANATQDNIAMDMTKPLGSIFANVGSPGLKLQSPVRFHHATAIEPNRSPTRLGWREKPRASIVTSATGSPALSQSRPGTRPESLKRLSFGGTPSKSPQTPSKQITPKPVKPTSPVRSTPLKNVTMRTPSPKKLFQNELKKTTNSPKSTTPTLFNAKGSGSNRLHDLGSFAKRRVSDIGADKIGLGSPKVTALLDRRTSIGNTAPVFAPQDFFSRDVRFEDPRLLAAEVTHERQEEHRRESGQFILEQEADVEMVDRDVTTSLREAIGSMTPKKSKSGPKPRKSLATGSAKGLLGKRPLELDDEDEDEDATPKTLKGRQSSPVKKVKLQGPPSKWETTGRQSLKRPEATINERPFTPKASSPTKLSTVTTPRSQGRFKDAERLPSAQKPIPTMGQTEGCSQYDVVDADVKEKISLQDFLNLTNIRFMDLTMTKRRHNAPPTPHQRAAQQEHNALGNEDESKFFEDCVVAGACTIPMLELYQHSCRELKKYISEGRDIVREIEFDTLQENPQLFREYTSASPAQRAVMDDQFKNMKAHARHLSKGMWYEWRMQLLESLVEGLNGVGSGMARDAELLDEQDALLRSTLPDVIQEHSRLTEECEGLQARADELAESNQDELKYARASIVDASQEIEALREQIQQRRQAIEEADEAIENAQEAKVEYTQAINEARRVREEFRGWSVKEVNSLRASVEALEAQTGWSVTSVESTKMTMTYRGQLELFFDVAAFSPLASAETGNQPVGLAFVGDSSERAPVPLTTEKRFFLQLMRAHLQSIEQFRIGAGLLLRLVSTGWDKAISVAQEVARLDDECPTHCEIVSDERLAVNCAVLLKNVETRVQVRFEVQAGVGGGGGLHVSADVAAHVVYGEPYRSDKMREFLRSRVGRAVDAGHVAGGWAGAMMELKRRLVAQGRKN